MVAAAHCTNSVHIFSWSWSPTAQLVKYRSTTLFLCSLKRNIFEKSPSFETLFFQSCLNLVTPECSKQLLRRRLLSEVSLGFAALSCSWAFPGGHVRGGWTETEWLSSGAIRVKCLTRTPGIRVDDVMTMEVQVRATPGPLNQISW